MRFVLNNPSETARFISARIDGSHKSQQQIAIETGLGTIDDISMIKTGMAKLPVAKIGTFAKALDVDPIELLSMCLQEYFPETWESISPFFETALTADEISLIKSLRFAVGGPYVMALTQKERKPLDEFLQGLRSPTIVQ